MRAHRIASVHARERASPPRQPSVLHHDTHLHAPQATVHSSDVELAWLAWHSMHSSMRCDRQMAQDSITMSCAARIATAEPWWESVRPPAAWSAPNTADRRRQRRRQPFSTRNLVPPMRGSVAAPSAATRQPRAVSSDDRGSRSGPFRRPSGRAAVRRRYRSRTHDHSATADHLLTSNRRPAAPAPAPAAAPPSSFASAAMLVTL